MLGVTYPCPTLPILNLSAPPVPFGALPTLTEILFAAGTVIAKFISPSTGSPTLGYA